MRRAEKEITGREELEEVLSRALVCRVGMSEQNRPYIVPMNFCYDNGCIYLHSATSGKKLEVLRENNMVCFEAEVDVELVKAENPCSWTMKYRSVIGFGKAYFVEDFTEKHDIMNLLMKKYSGKSDYRFPGEAIDRIHVIRIAIEQFSGKKSRLD